MKKRRYASGRFNAYDKAYSRFRAGSQVMNPDADWGLESIINLGQRNDVSGALHARKGESGLLLAAESAVEWVKTRFKAYQEKQVASGKRKPKEMPQGFLDDLHKAQARLDVVKDEVTRLEELLAEFTEEDQQVSSAAVLARGPQGTSSMKGGEIHEVDGQKVGKNDNGMFEIMDDRSRYDGMVVPDYFEEIVKPWNLANIKLLREYEKAVKRGEFRRDQKATPRAPWPEKPAELAA